MSDQAADTMPDLPDAGGHERVVRYRFGLREAAVILCAGALAVAVLNVPAPIEPATETPALLLPPQDAVQVWTESDIQVLRNAFSKPAPSSEPKVPPGDPRVDEAFAALNHANLRELDAFAAAYRTNPYAIAQGYVAQVDKWREAIRWHAEEARLKKEQSEAVWDYD